MITVTAKLELSDTTQLDDLMQRWSSCRRFAYQRIINNETLPSRRALNNQLKQKFNLNIRYVECATEDARSLISACEELETNPKNVVFGGKKQFFQLKKRHLATQQRAAIKEKYRERRQCNLYSRGDKNSKGNLNTQLVGSQLRINIGNHKYIYAQVITSHKKWPQLLASPCYSVRIKRENNQYYAHFSFSEDIPEITTTFASGAIGVDLNAFPSHIAWSETDKEGNYLNSGTINTHWLYDSRTGKRDYYAWQYAHELVNLAKQKNKGIVLEYLKFKKHNTRATSNFCYAKLKQAIVALCARSGIECKFVNPAYSSVIGCIKYAPLYGLSRHTSAALVIARRGLGYDERLPKSFACRVNRTRVTQEKKEASSEKKFSYVYEVCKIAVLTERFTRSINWSVFKPFVVAGDYSRIPKLVPLLGGGTGP